MMPAEYFTYTGRDGDIAPHDVTHVRVHKSVNVIPANAFNGYPNLEELDCDVGVEKVEAWALSQCPSLRRVIMPGVRVVEEHHALYECEALTVVECGKLEIIGYAAFKRCKSLRSINLPSAKVVEALAFIFCYALTEVKFGDQLERIENLAFKGCRSLERITLPLKDGLITRDDIFQGCKNLEHVDPVGGIHETVAALQLEEWRNDMDDEIDSINQILPNAPAGTDSYMGEKAMVIRMWIRSVLRKIIHYKAQHHRLLDEAATTLELASLPKDIVIESVLPFLELPSYTFEVGRVRRRRIDVA
ncbi:hypothetical protein QTG54_014351 [Skeletonema marinoi]|uniref:Leucine-rich repeat domain-containing protein n=2 Tax=Skeletonema marinoi TaxID=267567 RepID=A0AAD9D5K7_9STRA|nr:hypothetical protein QTG54_014351 [Skeletonema marinoi]